MSARIQASCVAGPRIAKVVKNLSSAGCALWIPNRMTYKTVFLMYEPHNRAWIPSVVLSRYQVLESLLNSCKSPVGVLLSPFYLQGE